MTKFDFKQWIINNKHGKKSLNENMEMIDEAPATACDPGITTCHAFSKCNASYQDDGNIKNYTVSQFGNPLSFWQTLGSPTGTNQHIRVSGGDVFIYKGIIVGDLANNGNTPPANPQNICGCNPGCTNPGATNYDPDATCNDGSCIMPPPGFSECQNCCCRSSLQMKISPQDQDGLTKGNNMEPRINPDGGVFDKEIRENINPTVDAIDKLIILAEQRRRPKSDRIARDYEKEMEKSPQDFEPGEMPIDPTLAPSALTPASPIGPGVIAGPCDAGHYTNPGNVGSASGGFAPDPVVGNIDPTTGMCECNNNDPNNPFGMITITAGYMNPNPGTPNTTGASNGTGAC